MDVRLTDNSRNAISLPEAVNPVAASGITITTTAAGNDYTQTLEDGARYAITYVATAGKRMFASITGVTSTAANIEWVFMANQTYIFRMPHGSTTFYFEGDDATKKAYLRKLAG